MKHILLGILPLKVLVGVGAAFLIISGSIVFGLIDASMLIYTGNDLLTRKIIYTTGGFGFVVMVLAGMYYFQYKYRL